MEKASVNSSTLRLSELRSVLRQFFTAAKANNVDDVQAAISKLRGYVDKQRPEYDGLTPLQKALHIAVCENKKDSHIKTIEMLLDNGTAQNCLEKNDPLLHRMIHQAQVKTIELFLDSGTDVHVRDNKGEISLFKSIRMKNIEIVKLLLNHSSDVNSVNVRGSTPLHLAAEIFGQSDHELSLIEVLLKSGGNLNAQDGSGYTPLHYSVHMNKVKLVELLLKSKPDVNIKDNFNEIPLFVAVRGGNSEVVKLLVNHGSEVNSINKNKETPLLLATILNNYNDDDLGTIEVLLKNGADVNVQNKRSETPLHHLVRRNKAKAIKLLLDYKADVTVKDFKGEIPLFGAVKNGNLEIVQLLINFGSDVDIINQCKETPLQLATALTNDDDDLGMVEALLKSGANVNYQDNNGKTILHSLVHNNRVKTVKLFLDYKADVNIKDNDGEIPLFSAVRNGNLEIIKLLVDFGSDVNIINEGNETSLDLATNSICYGSDFYGEDEIENNLPTVCDDNIVELLLKSGANVNSQDEIGKTKLYYLVHSNSVNMVKLFLEYKADVNVKDFRGEIPLSDAVRNGNFEIIKLLVDFGSDVNIVNENNETLLHLATSTENFIYNKNNYNIVELLLKSGENQQKMVNVQNRYGKTVLHYLVRCKNVKIVKLFLSFEPNLNLKDDYGKTPLLCATANAEILQLLLDYGTDVNCTDNNGRTPLHYLAANYNNEFFNIDSSEIFIRHIAKLQALNLFIHAYILDAISERKFFSDYFASCLEELTAAKSTRLQNSWITLFNILTDNTRKLKNYAGNASLIEEFNKIDSVKNYPIYGPMMQENVEKGIRRRELFDQSSIMLSYCLPIFNPNNLIIRDILDCLVASKDLSKFCA